MIRALSLFPGPPCVQIAYFESRMTTAALHEDDQTIDLSTSMDIQRKQRSMITLPTTNLGHVLDRIFF